MPEHMVRWNMLPVKAKIHLKQKLKLAVAAVYNCNVSLSLFVSSAEMVVLFHAVHTAIIAFSMFYIFMNMFWLFVSVWIPWPEWLGVAGLGWRWHRGECTYHHLHLTCFPLVRWCGFCKLGFVHWMQMTHLRVLCTLINGAWSTFLKLTFLLGRLFWPWRHFRSRSSW